MVKGVGSDLPRPARSFVAAFERRTFEPFREGALCLVSASAVARSVPRKNRLRFLQCNCPAGNCTFTESLILAQDERWRRA